MHRDLSMHLNSAFQ